MGFGGILASIAQGVGTGMVKVADENWKKQAKEREYDYYGKVKDLDRQHDFDLEDKKHQHEIELKNMDNQNKIKIAAMQARGKGETKEGKLITEFKDVIGGIDIRNAEISKINESLPEIQDGVKNGTYSQEYLDKTLAMKKQLEDANTRALSKENLMRFDPLKSESVTASLMARGADYSFKNPVKVEQPIVPIETDYKVNHNTNLIDGNDPIALKKATLAYKEKNREQLKKSLNGYNTNGNGKAPNNWNIGINMMR